MATKFTDLKVGQKFYANGGNGYEQYKKVSALEYESIQNSILGTFYATPGFTVDLTEKKAATPKLSPATKAKKSAKR
jgi:hypothetical protein